MFIHEWSTSATDLMLAIACIWLAYRINRICTADSDAQWGIARALGVCAVSALIGAVRHGFKPELSDIAYGGAWIIGYLFIIAAGTLLLWGVLCGLVRNAGYRTVLDILCVSKLAIFSFLFLIDSGTLWVAVSFGLDIGIIGAWSLTRLQHPVRRWLSVGAVGSLIAGLVQCGVLIGTGGALHDDLFHLLMIPAVYAFYRAALIIPDF